jgi:hypothetical protein
MTMRWTDRWGPLTGVAGIALMVAAFFVAGSSPDTGDPDAKIVNYVTSDSNQTQNLVGWLLSLLAVLCLLAFVAALRNRLNAAEGGVGRFASAAFAGGIVSFAALAASIALFVSTILTADDTGRFHADADLYRLTNDLGYEFWVLSGVSGALLVWSTMVVAFRNGLFPRWFGWFSAAAGVFALLAVFFVPMFVYWLWIVIVSILLVRATPAAPPPAA